MISWTTCIYLSIYLLHLVALICLFTVSRFYPGVVTLWVVCRLTSEPNIFRLRSVKLWGLFLRSLVNHKALEECSFRPVLFQFIVELLFSTVCFLLRKLCEVLIPFPAAIWPRKEAATTAALFVKMALCEGVVLNRIKIDIYMAAESVWL